MSAPRHDGAMDLLVDVRRALGAVADRALDLALPASCAGCGQEGDALCRECRPAIDVRLAADPGVATTPTSRAAKAAINAKRFMCLGFLPGGLRSGKVAEGYDVAGRRMYRAMS